MRKNKNNKFSKLLTLNNKQKKKKKKSKLLTRNEKVKENYRVINIIEIIS